MAPIAIGKIPSVFIFDSFSENCDLTSSNHCFRTVFFHNAYLMYCIACIGDRYLFLWFYGWLSYPNNTYVLFLAQHELHELGHFLAQFTKNSLPKIKNSPFLITNRNFYPKPKVIYTKYSKHWLYIVAHTIECVCSKMNNSWFNPWFSFYFSTLYPAPYIEWFMC